MNRQTSWLRRGVALAAAFLVSSAGWGAAALPGYSGGRLQVVGELGEDSSYVHYHLNGAEKTAADMTWSDQGHTGQAISLNGAGETLELYTAEQDGLWYAHGADGAGKSRFEGTVALSQLPLDAAAAIE